MFPVIDGPLRTAHRYFDLGANGELPLGNGQWRGAAAAIRKTVNDRNRKTYRILNSSGHAGKWNWRDVGRRCGRYGNKGGCAVIEIVAARGKHRSQQIVDPVLVDSGKDMFRLRQAHSGFVAIAPKVTMPIRYL